MPKEILTQDENGLCAITTVEMTLEDCIEAERERRKEARERQKEEVLWEQARQIVDAEEKKATKKRKISTQRGQNNNTEENV